MDEERVDVYNKAEVVKGMNLYVTKCWMVMIYFTS
jgi:hypothetical protein